MRRQCAPGRVRFRRFPSRAPFAVAAFLAVRVARAAWVPPRGDLACGDAACGGSRASRCARNARVPPRADAAARTDTRTRTGRRFDRSMPSISRISSRTWIVRSSAGAARRGHNAPPSSEGHRDWDPPFVRVPRALDLARADGRATTEKAKRAASARRGASASPTIGRIAAPRVGKKRDRADTMGAKTLEDLEKEVRRGPSPRRASFVRPSVSSVARGRDGDGGGPRARSLPPRGTPSRARCHACIFALQQTLAREKTNRTNRIPR